MPKEESVVVPAPGSRPLYRQKPIQLTKLELSRVAEATPSHVLRSMHFPSLRMLVLAMSIASFVKIEEAQPPEAKRLNEVYVAAI